MILTKVLFGFLAGVTASLGLGGGFFLLIYLLIFEKANQLQAQSTNLFFFIIIAIISIIISAKNKLIDFKKVLFCSIFGLCGVILGLFIEFYVSISFTRKIFAVFLMLVGLKELFLI